MLARFIALPLAIASAEIISFQALTQCKRLPAPGTSQPCQGARIGVRPRRGKDRLPLMVAASIVRPNQDRYQDRYQDRSPE